MIEFLHHIVKLIFIFFFVKLWTTIVVLYIFYIVFGAFVKAIFGGYF